MKLLNIYHQGNIIHSQVLVDENHANEIFEQKTCELDTYNQAICEFTLTDLHPDYIEELRQEEQTAKSKKKK